MEQSSNGSPETETKPLSGREKRLRNLRPFGPGPDPRRFKGGRPKSFDDTRRLAQAIAHEELTLNDGRKVSIVEAVFRKLVNSKEPRALQIFLEYAFGKVPDELKATGLENKTNLVLHFDHEKGVTRE